MRDWVACVSVVGLELLPGRVGWLGAAAALVANETATARRLSSIPHAKSHQPIKPTNRDGIKKMATVATQTATAAPVATTTTATSTATGGKELREIGHEAVWSLSTAKPGNGTLEPSVCLWMRSYAPHHHYSR
jgi:hypothetical protein